VPSSTSSSSERAAPARVIPDGTAFARIGTVRLGRAWLLAAGLVLLVLGSSEGLWRARGFAPALRDGPRLWAFERARASRLGRRALVLVGASRMQVDMDLRALAAGTGMEPVQLAIDGTSGVPVLADLAADESFRGTVVFSLMPGLAAEDDTRAREYVAFYHEQGLSDRLEFPLWETVQRSLVSRSPALSHNVLIRAAFGRGMPTPGTGGIRPDRSRPFDYTVFDAEPRRRRVERALALRPAPSCSPEEFLADCARHDAMARRIRARGGEVVFVRMPISGGLWTLDARRYPRADYWDRFAATADSPTIHFADYPSLSRFECPDFSHLDASDAPAFTRAFARILMEKLGR
jgi:hypothetical protein